MLGVEKLEKTYHADIAEQGRSESADAAENHL